MSNVFGFTEFREYIKAEVADKDAIRGYQGRIAEAANCQKSYFSRVLRGDAKLNSDQAMRLALFWQMSEEETEYFLALVALDRADFEPLRKRLRKKLETLRARGTDLSKRFATTGELNEQEAQFYYSTWFWSALHLLVGVPGHGTVAALADRLNLPRPTVEATLAKLEKMGLVEKLNGRWNTIPRHLYLPAASPLNSINHFNWRQKAVTSAGDASGGGLHYTCLQTHGLADVPRLREIFLEAIEKSRLVVKAAPNEELTAICVDFFSVR